VIVMLNGESRELPPGATVASVVSLVSVASSARGLAVAVQGEVVPRGAWASTELADGAEVEVVAAIQGG
jgi:sulfur carrier protein